MNTYTITTSINGTRTQAHVVADSQANAARIAAGSRKPLTHVEPVVKCDHIVEAHYTDASRNRYFISEAE